MITIIGLIASVCTASSFLPQVIRALRTKRTKDISLPMYVIMSLGAFLWASYGLLKADMIIIIVNITIFILTSIMLVLKLKNG